MYMIFGSFILFYFIFGDTLIVHFKWHPV